MDGDECSEEMLETYHVAVFPTFLLYKFGQLKGKLEIETSMQFCVFCGLLELSLNQINGLAT